MSEHAQDTDAALSCPELSKLTKLEEMRLYNSNEIDLERNLSELRQDLVDEVVYDCKKRRHA